MLNHFFHPFFLLILMTADLQASPDLVLSRVNVITMTSETVLKDQDVWIENGFVKKITPAGKIKIPAGTKTVIARGKYLMPGLTDMHAHFFYEQGDNVNTCEAELKIMLANGLTTARIQCGDSVYLHARQMVREKKWLGPQLYVSSPQFVGEWPWPGKMLAMIVTNAEEAKAAVKKCRQQDYDEIKITFMVKRPVYDAIVVAAKENNIKVTGHVGPDVKLPRALEARQQIEHMDEFIDMLLPDSSYNHGQSVSDMNIWRKAAWETVLHLQEAKIPDLVQKVKAADICVTPTNFFFFSSFGTGMTEEEIKARPDYDYIPEKIKAERWRVRDYYWKKPPSEDKRNRYVDMRSRITYALWAAGVKLMAGPIHPNGFWCRVFPFTMNCNVLSIPE